MNLTRRALPILPYRVRRHQLLQLLPSIGRSSVVLQQFLNPTVRTRHPWHCQLPLFCYIFTIGELLPGVLRQHCYVVPVVTVVLQGFKTSMSRRANLHNMPNFHNMHPQTDQQRKQTARITLIEIPLRMALSLHHRPVIGSTLLRPAANLSILLLRALMDSNTKYDVTCCRTRSCTLGNICCIRRQ